METYAGYLLDASFDSIKYELIGETDADLIQAKRPKIAAERLAGCKLKCIKMREIMALARQHGGQDSMPFIVGVIAVHRGTQGESAGVLMACGQRRWYVDATA